MKNKPIVLGLLSVGLGAVAFSAFAAGVVLTNGGLGQVASNPQSFGVAVCNGGSGTVTQSVPISITGNGESATITSSGSIAPGACQYSYANYSALGMAAGQTYAVNVTIDPSNSIISNSNNQATYSVTVPTAQPAVTATANATGSTNFLGSIGAIFSSFFTALKNLF